MPKVTVELTCKAANHIATLYTLARLVELFDQNEPAPDSDEDEFWRVELPSALYNLGEAIAYLTIDHVWDTAEAKALFSYSHDWDKAIDFWEGMIESFRKLEAQTGFTERFAFIDRGTDDEQARANGQ